MASDERRSSSDKSLHTAEFPDGILWKRLSVSLARHSPFSLVTLANVKTAAH